MINYEYEDIADQPNIATWGRDAEGNLILISGIQYDVANSEMTDMGIISGTWWKDSAKLELVFEDELSSSDKAILDQIVVDNE